MKLHFSAKKQGQKLVFTPPSTLQELQEAQKYQKEREELLARTNDLMAGVDQVISSLDSYDNQQGIDHNPTPGIAIVSGVELCNDSILSGPVDAEMRKTYKYPDDFTDIKLEKKDGTRFTSRSGDWKLSDKTSSGKERTLSVTHYSESDSYLVMGDVLVADSKKKWWPF